MKPHSIEDIDIYYLSVNFSKHDEKHHPSLSDTPDDRLESLYIKNHMGQYYTCIHEAPCMTGNIIILYMYDYQSRYKHDKG